MNTELKTIPLDDLIDQHIGKIGTEKRDAFEYELRLDLLSLAVKQARKDRNLTQEQLGKMVGVQKAQISKIENSVKSTKLETLLKIFDALKVKVSFSLDYQ